MDRGAKGAAGAIGGSGVIEAGAGASASVSDLARADGADVAGGCDGVCATLPTDTLPSTVREDDSCSLDASRLWLCSSTTPPYNTTKAHNTRPVPVFNPQWRDGALDGPRTSPYGSGSPVANSGLGRNSGHSASPSAEAVRAVRSLVDATPAPALARLADSVGVAREAGCDASRRNASLAWAPQCGQNDTGSDTRAPQRPHVAGKVISLAWRSDVVGMS